MINITKHGKEYKKKYDIAQVHIYKCGYYRSLHESVGGCGCEFTATLADFHHMVVGHGEMDYVTHCPECSRTIYDSINRVD